MADKTDKTNTADATGKTKPRRSAKSKRIHTRRLKAAARAAGVART